MNSTQPYPYMEDVKQRQTPLWHSDPYMGLVTQYKALAYAIYDQIDGRISREFQHGNLRVLLPALSYVPVVIATELLRELIQYGIDGNAQRKSWGPDDYLKLGVEKSGLLGPQYAMPLDIRQDIQRGYAPGSSQLGPAASQAKNALDRQDLGKTFEDALPGSEAFKRWNDLWISTAPIWRPHRQRIKEPCCDRAPHCLYPPCPE
jgi:hypothetical protein